MNVPSTACLTQMLPGEIFPLVFSHLDIKDLGRIAQVCKIFNEIQNKSEIWENVLKNLPKKAGHFVSKFSYLNSINSKLNVEHMIIHLPNILNENKLKIYFQSTICTITTTVSFEDFNELNKQGKEDFFKDVSSYFPDFKKKYYIEFEDRYFKYGFIYYDENNQIQFSISFPISFLMKLTELEKSRKKIRLKFGYEGLANVL